MNYKKLRLVPTTEEKKVLRNIIDKYSTLVIIYNEHNI